MPLPVILSIDDDPFFRDLYRNIFESKGYSFLSAMDAAEGLAIATKKRPDIILLDVMMPEMKGYSDGFSLLEEFRRTPSFNDIPIIMISALGDDADAKHGFALGATDYLPKQEMTPHLLLEKIEKILDKKGRP